MRLFPTACLAALVLTGPVSAEEVGRIGVDWVGNDIIVEAIRDPKVSGVTCHLAYFERSLLYRLNQGNWFQDPSNSAIECSRTGPVSLQGIRQGREGETVFDENRSLIFKSLRVRRILDTENRVLVYVAHANELTQGSAKMAISTVALTEDEITQLPVKAPR